MARPSNYTVEQADAICEHIASGKSLVSWCNEDRRPAYTTVMRWIQQQPEFRNKYAGAREAQADYLAEEIVQIADTPLLGVTTKVDDSGKRETTEGDMLQHRRLQVDARKWYASKLAPKKYGDKVETTLTGSVDHNLTVTFVGQ
jgi:hypothetical protein